MKTKFLSICLGITLILFGAGFFVASIKTAHAAPNKTQKLLLDVPGKTGKYSVSISFGADKYLYATAVNTETGKSETYYIYTDGGGKWVKMTNQLPDFTF